MTSPAIDFKDMLVSAGIGTFAASSGWAIYVGQQPDSPDTCITVYDAPGESPDPRNNIDYPAPMVRVRGAVGDYVNGYNKAEYIKKALLGKAAATVNGNRYTGIWMRGGINHLGFDDKNRPEFTLNFLVAMEPASPGNRTS